MKWGAFPRVFVYAVAAAFLLAATHSATAGTILKVSLGDDAAADIQYDGTDLSTIDETGLAKPGDQNTAVEFLDFVGFNSPIPADDGSFTLADVEVDGPATVLVAENLVVQPFMGGYFELYDAANMLLLSATLGDSVLSGPLGGSATGALFTTTLGTVTGGSLEPLIDPNSISLSISMTDVAGGSGFSVTDAPGGSMLDPFSADVTANIGAEERAIPEPASATLAIMSGLLIAFLFRRKT